MHYLKQYIIHQKLIKCWRLTISYSYILTAFIESAISSVTNCSNSTLSLCLHSKMTKNKYFCFSQTHEFTYANLIWQTQKSISLNTNVLKTMYSGSYEFSAICNISSYLTIVGLCIFNKWWQYLLDIFKRSTKTMDTNHVTCRTHIQNAVVYIVVEDWQRLIVCLCAAWLTIINF